MRPSEQITHLGLGLPLDRGFTSAEALHLVGRRRLRRLLATGLVRPLVRGAYAVSDVPLTVEMRAEILGRVLSPRSVVTDLTAAWLHGVDLMDHRGELPPLDIVRLDGETRIRRTGVVSGTRMLQRHDVELIEGMWVTTPLRTALDLGRRLRPDRALAALDGLMRTRTFTTDDLVSELPRFRGHRGVIQLRALTPMADWRAESPPESRVRYHWLTAGSLPRPDLQIPIPNPLGGFWRFDLGVKACRFGVEYDGAEYHSSPEQRRRDREKREYAEQELAWHVAVLTHELVYARPALLIPHLTAEFTTACLKLGRPTSEFRWPQVL